MSFVFESSNRLDYDFFDTWTRRLEVAIEAYDAIKGDPSFPPVQPGTFTPTEGHAVIRVTIEVTQENT